MASAEKIRCKVTDTKQAILKTYKNHIEEINARQKGSLDPAKIQTEKKNTETLTRVQTISNLDVPKTLHDLQVNINNTLAGILNTLDKRKQELADVIEAIDIKKGELNELYGIEKEAHTLAALIESHEEQRRELQEELDTAEKENEALIAELRKTAEKTKKELDDQIAELKRNAAQTRQREEEEYKYNFARNKQSQLDALNDEIAKRNLEAAKREEAVTLREKTMTELEGKVKELEAKIVSEVERVRKETELSEKKSAQTAAQFASMSHKAEVDRLTSQLEAANSRSNDLLAQNTKLQDALDRANEKVQNIAVEALKSGADAKTIAELRNFESNRSGK